MPSMRRLSLFLLVWLVAVPVASAQNAASPLGLLPLLPDDFAVCVVMHDLRGHAARWEKSDWYKKFRQSPIGKNVFDSPEMKQFERWQEDAKKHLDLDWPTVRDDLLGDTLILAYSPGQANQPDDERGLFLLHVRRPEKLQRLIDQLNEGQRKSGELKSLTEHQHQGETYFRRVQDKKTQYYLIKGSLAAFTVKEDLMKGLIQKRVAQVKETPWTKAFAKAGADRALITMCVNPRMLDAEVMRDGKKGDPIPSYWRALDAIFVTVAVQDDAELRVSIQANVAKLPQWAKPAFTRTISSSSLWQRFPETSVFTMASMTDFAGTAEAISLLMTEPDRKKLTKDLGNIGKFLQLDPFKDVLPNLGPDWGICMLPSRDANQMPSVIVALAVKPGNGEKPVDQALFNTVDFFAKLASLQNPDAIRLQSMKQGDVEVKYLTGDKLFPPGFQPACALKDGFLIFATTPQAIAEFRLRPRSGAMATNESILLRISTSELAKLLDHRRDHILSTLTKQKQMTDRDARKHLENVVSLLNLFDRATLSQQGDAGQTSWIIRLSPK